LVFAHPAGLLLLGLAILPVLGPRTPVVTLVALLPVVGWLVATTLYEEPLTLWRLIPLAWALYLLHSAAALAAHLPYDAIVSPGVLLRWFSRTGLVLAATAVVALYALVAGEQLRGRATLIATVVGIAIAAGVAALLARQLRRR
jgi:hypothetical protein